MAIRLLRLNQGCAAATRAWLVAAYIAVVPASAIDARADTPAPLEVSIAFVHEQIAEPPPLSLVEPVATDKGLAGARLAIVDNNTTGRFLNQQYELKEVIVPAGGADSLYSEGLSFLAVSNCFADATRRGPCHRSSAPPFEKGWIRWRWRLL